MLKFIVRYTNFTLYFQKQTDSNLLNINPPFKNSCLCFKTIFAIQENENPAEKLLKFKVNINVTKGNKGKPTLKIPMLLNHHQKLEVEGARGAGGGGGGGQNRGREGHGRRKK